MNTSVERPTSDCVRLEKPRAVRGEIVVPGDKSISHRAAIFNALARGRATITNYSTGADCASTLDCLRQLGVDISVGLDDAAPIVRVIGADGQLTEPDRPLDAGNSGTTLRLLAGVVAGQPLFSILAGDESLNRRPMARIADPLRQMGASILGRKGGSLPPLAIQGGDLHGIDYTSPVASAQVKSCLLLAGLRAAGETVVRGPSASRDHSERLLRAQGAAVTVDGPNVAVSGGARLQAVDVEVPGDFSSAAYWLVLACAHPDAEVVIRGVGTNPGRTGLLDILREMGADVDVRDERVVAGEPRATLIARTSRLRAVTVGGSLIPRAIDELPLVAILALFAEGVTEIRDAAELRVKESDRIASLATELARLGASVEELPDGIRVAGRAPVRDVVCTSYGDHRLAMSLAIAGLVGGALAVEGARSVSISYPTFWDDARSLGGLVDCADPCDAPQLESVECR